MRKIPAHPFMNGLQISVRGNGTSSSTMADESVETHELKTQEKITKPKCRWGKENKIKILVWFILNHKSEIGF